jgi:hypothetical protein
MEKLAIFWKRRLRRILGRQRGMYQLENERSSGYNSLSSGKKVASNDAKERDGLCLFGDDSLRGHVLFEDARFAGRLATDLA